MTDPTLTEIVQAAMARTATLHSALESQHAGLSDCVCGLKLLTITEHAKHLAGELMRMLAEDFGLDVETSPVACTCGGGGLNHFHSTSPHEARTPGQRMVTDYWHNTEEQR